jgi:superfamily I DNA and/or RNA helicase
MPSLSRFENRVLLTRSNRYREREGGVVKKVLAESQVSLWKGYPMYQTVIYMIYSQIVLATCHSSGGRQLDKQEFDVVIIDEATQALEAVSFHLHDEEKPIDFE